MMLSRLCHSLAAVLMAAYVAAVVAGKLAMMRGAATPIALGDVGEFLVVLASIALFVSGILIARAEHASPYAHARTSDNAAASRD